ncbi:MAG: TolC family protein [Pseudomonadales bacterium]|nr:TolC family protein [Pseudomonadales bacterium]
MKPTLLLWLALLPAGCVGYQADPLPLVLNGTLPVTMGARQEIDLSAPLDQDAIAALAVLANPDLKVLRSNAGISQAQVFAAGLLPDPSISAGVDHIISGPDPVDNLALSLGLDINALRTRPVLRQQLQARAEQVRLDIVWAEWQTVGQAKLQALRAVLLAQIMQIAESNAADSRAILEANLRAASRGDIGAQRLQSALLSANDAAQTLRQAQLDLQVARAQLNRVLGLAPETVLQLVMPTIPTNAPGPQSLLSIALDSRADLQALQRGYAAQEAAVHKAVLDQFPVLDLSLNTARDTGNNVLVGPAVNFTLPVWNRNRGGIALELASREALKAEYENRLFQIRADIGAALASLSVERQQYQDQLAQAPALASYAVSSRQAAARGDMARIDASAAELALGQSQRLLLQTRLNMLEQVVALELLTGVSRQQWK